MSFRAWHGASIYLVALAGFAVGAERILGVSSTEQNSSQILLSPTFEHWFGTDSLGRDLFARVMSGASMSLSVAVAASVITLLVGVLVGGLAGWKGGWWDVILLRATDVFQAIPSFLLASLLGLTLQASLPVPVALIFGIALVHWFNVAKVTRGLTRQMKTFSYVESALALGAKPFRIFMKHLLPNMKSTLWVLFGLQIPASILYESTISFAGFGIQAPQVSWGVLLQDGWRSLSEFPHLLLLPALVLFATILAFQVLIQSLQIKR